jgi:hypothetical protein
VSSFTGYTDICGFRVPKSGPGYAYLGPVQDKKAPLNVEVTAGPSVYSLAEGLKINYQETLIDYCDEFLSRLPGVNQGGITIDPHIDSLFLSDSRPLFQADGYTISFHRTIRVPDDKKRYDLPERDDPIKLLPVSSFANRLPSSLAAKGGVMLSLYQREAMVLDFDDPYPLTEDPRFAVRVFAGSINCLTGEGALQQGKLRGKDRQDYLILPPQERLGGFYAGSNTCRQFVAMPVGSKYSAEWQITNKEFVGGLQLQIATKYPTDCSFWGRDSDSALKYTKTPNQLGLKTGQRVLMELSDKLWGKIDLLPSTANNNDKFFNNDQLYPTSTQYYRRTYVHELCRLYNSESPAMPSCLNIYAVFPYNIKLDWKSIDAGPPDSEQETFSPFLSTNHLISIIKSKAMSRKGPPLTETLRIQMNQDILSVTNKFTPLYYYPWDYGVVSMVFKRDFVFGPQGPFRGLGGEEQSQPPTRVVKGWDMGLAAGGRIRNPIQLDSNPSVWNWKRARIFNIQILNSVAFEEVTGIKPSPAPILIKEYMDANIPLKTFGNYLTRKALENCCPVLSQLNTVVNVDNHRHITTGISASGGKLICCMVCERNLCDSM